MFKERIQRFKNSWENSNRELVEFRQISKEFDLFMPIGGVLTRHGSPELDPIARGLLVAKNSEKLIDKLKKGKEVTEDEKREVREAAWITSIGGTYDIDFDLDREITSVLLKIDNTDLMDIWFKNRASLVALFVYREGNRSKRVKNIGIEFVEGDYPIKFDFPNGVDCSFFAQMFVSSVDLEKNLKERFYLLDYDSEA